jgi:hypothetical protein
MQFAYAQNTWDEPLMAHSHKNSARLLSTAMREYANRARATAPDPVVVHEQPLTCLDDSAPSALALVVHAAPAAGADENARSAIALPCRRRDPSRQSAQPLSPMAQV